MAIALTAADLAALLLEIGAFGKAGLGRHPSSYCPSLVFRSITIAARTAPIGERIPSKRTVADTGDRINDLLRCIVERGNPGARKCH